MQNLVTYFFIFWFGFAFLMIGGLIYWVVRIFRGRKKMTPEKVLHFLHSKVAGNTTKLVAHDDLDINRLNRRKGKHFYFKGSAHNRENGIVLDVDNQPMIFYVWSDPAIIMSKFQLLAVTDKDEYYIALKNERLELMVNDEFLCYYELLKGYLRDRAGNIIGFVNEKIESPWFEDRTLRTFDNHFYRENETDGFPMAFLSGTQAILFSNKHESQKAIECLTENPSQTEQQILMCLAIFYITDALERG